MRICLATYGDRLAALLENAGELRLFRIIGGKAEPDGVLPGPRGESEAMVAALARSGADALVCGAVCGRLKRRLEQAGVSVAPWIGGNVSDVLAAYLEGRLEHCKMPGSGGCRRCRRGRRAGKERT